MEVLTTEDFWYLTKNRLGLEETSSSLNMGELCGACPLEAVMQWKVSHWCPQLSIT